MPPIHHCSFYFLRNNSPLLFFFFFLRNTIGHELYSSRPRCIHHIRAGHTSRGLAHLYQPTSKAHLMQSKAHPVSCVGAHVQQTGSSQRHVRGPSILWWLDSTRNARGRHVAGVNRPRRTRDESVHASAGSSGDIAAAPAGCCASSSSPPCDSICFF